MTMKQSIGWLGFLFLAGALVACGGGSGGGGSSAGIDRTGVTIAAGPVTGFGSIIVNGVRYDTSSATFTIDDNPGGQDDLSVGDVVVLRGTLNADLTTGTATSVIYDAAVEGPVEEIDSTGSRLVVMGQTVLATPDTSFDDSIPGGVLSGLNAGDVVEVSGLVQATGEISATRIEAKPAGGEFEVRGPVASLTATTFMLANLLVDYSIAQLRDLPAGGLAEGQLVEVKGTNYTPPSPPGTPAPVLVASTVEGKMAGFGGVAGDRLEIEGFITRFGSATDFDVSGQRVTTNAATVYTGGIGASAADLGVNVKVEIKGQLNSAGSLVASRVDIRRAKAVRIFAALDSVDTANDRFILLGIEVRTDVLTRFEDKTDADVEPLRLTDLNSGEYLEVRGSEDPASSAGVIAALVERDDVDDTLLQGFVAAVAQPSLEILGVTIETGGAVFRDIDDSPMSAQEFFAAIGPGSLVKAQGVESSATVLTASEVELELEF